MRFVAEKQLYRVHLWIEPLLPNVMLLLIADCLYLARPVFYIKFMSPRHSSTIFISTVF